MANDWTLIDHWVDDQSDEGQALKLDPRIELPLFHADNHPEFSPLEWNAMEQRANCLSYALNAMGENLQPGYVRPPHFTNRPDLIDAFSRVSYRMFQDIPSDEFKEIVRMGLELDGLECVQDIEGLYKPDHYLIGLYFIDKDIAGLSDFHFTRLDSNGYWSMARYNGYSGISFLDSNEDKIKNPATARLNAGVNFDAFYHVPKGGIETLRPRFPSI